MDSVHWGLGKERPDLVWTIRGGINKEILFITFANRWETSGKCTMQVEKLELVFQNRKLHNLAIGHFGTCMAIGKNKAGNSARIRA